MATDGHAELIGGPEDGRTIFVGGCTMPPPRIDFEVEGGRVARYVRCTRFQFDARRSGGCGRIGQPSYRFRGYVSATVEEL